MKRLLLSFIFLLALVLAVTLLWPGHNYSAPLILPDGSTIRIVGATYGTNHLHGPFIYKWVMRSPAPIRNFLKSTLAKFPDWQDYATAQPELVVWIDVQNRKAPLTNSLFTSPYLNAFIGDQANFTSGGESYAWNSGKSPRLEHLEFSAFPRRDRELVLSLFGNARDSATNLGALRFPNPAFRNYPRWKPESLPATKTTTNLELTLFWVETGHADDLPLVARTKDGTRFRTPSVIKDGRNFTFFETRLRVHTNIDEAWKIDSVEISDATGNNLSSLALNSIGWPADLYSSFSPSLWPGEDAWKLKFHLRQTAGFPPAQQLIFHDVPLGDVGTTNILSWANLPHGNWSTNFQGVKVTLDYIVHRPPFNLFNLNSESGTELQFTTSVFPKGTYVDLLSCVVDSTNTCLPELNSDTGTRRWCFFQHIPASAKKADFIFAVHQSRTVEFTVHPDLPVPRGVGP